jgi:hypothetical protein
MKIDVGVPIPASRTSRKYPFDEMNVGDSFFLEIGSSVQTLAGSANRTHAPKKFAQRRVTEAGVDGFRIWRTE